MIEQHSNGNSYLFIDNRVFVSQYDETIKQVITKELNLRHDSLTDWEIEKIIKHIGFIFPDGFRYVVCIHSYGSHLKCTYDNLKEACDEANYYYEDNGYAYLFTNNKNVNVRLSGGGVYYHPNPDQVSAYAHPEDAVELNPIDDSNEEEQEEEF
jgi:hypothetical protein